VLTDPISQSKTTKHLRELTKAAVDICSWPQIKKYVMRYARPLKNL